MGSLCYFPGNYVYLIKQREFVRTNEPVVKVGRSRNIMGRLRSYDIGSVILGWAEKTTTKYPHFLEKGVDTGSFAQCLRGVFILRIAVSKLSVSLNPAFCNGGGIIW